MSVTFSLASKTDEGTDSTCADYEAHRICDNVDHLADLADYGTCDCQENARHACVWCGSAVNVSNSNAMLILERLGVEFDYCGSLDPADLLGRAMVGNVGRDDSGAPSATLVEPGKATVVDCGARAGYFEDRLGSLASLANLAIRYGAVIQWG